MNVQFSLPFNKYQVAGELVDNVIILSRFRISTNNLDIVLGNPFKVIIYKVTEKVTRLHRLMVLCFDPEDSSYVGPFIRSGSNLQTIDKLV